LPGNCSQCPCICRGDCTWYPLEPPGSAARGTGACFGSLNSDAISWSSALLLITHLFKSHRDMQGDVEAHFLIIIIIIIIIIISKTNHK
jgi:hypothetical protein